MSVDMIIGVTIGTQTLIQSLQRRGAANIMVMDEDHEGPPVDIDGVTYYSTKEALQFCNNFPGVTFHFIRCKSGMMNINGIDFGD